MPAEGRRSRSSLRHNVTRRSTWSSNLVEECRQGQADGCAKHEAAFWSGTADQSLHRIAPYITRCDPSLKQMAMIFPTPSSGGSEYQLESGVFMDEAPSVAVLAL